MKRILFFSTLIVLLASCGKEDDLQPKSNFLNDLLGLYVGVTSEATSQEIVTRDMNGNVVDVTTVFTDTMYQDTIEFIAESADSTFSFIQKGQTIGPLKWNEDRIYNFVDERQNVDLDIEIDHDPVAESLNLTVSDNPDSDTAGQATIIKKYNFAGTKE